MHWYSSKSFYLNVQSPLVGQILYVHYSSVKIIILRIITPLTWVSSCLYGIERISQTRNTCRVRTAISLLRSSIYNPVIINIMSIPELKFLNLGIPKLYYLSLKQVYLASSIKIHYKPCYCFSHIVWGYGR